jgi:hypothetical protein
MIVTSGGVRKRIGGPHVPEPLLAYKFELFPRLKYPVYMGKKSRVIYLKGKI